MGCDGKGMMQTQNSPVYMCNFYTSKGLRARLCTPQTQKRDSHNAMPHQDHVNIPSYRATRTMRRCLPSGLPAS